MEYDKEGDDGMIKIVKDAGNVLFIGEYVVGGLEIYLSNPRVLEFLKLQGGQSSINIGEIIGSPKRVDFPLGVVSWDVQNEVLVKKYWEAVRKKYWEAVSGLVLPLGGGKKVLTPSFAS